MPVDSIHPSYSAAEKKWSIVEDCIAGELRIKERRSAYLPRLSDQSDEDYRAYAERAQFFNATAKTADSLLGFVYRKDPEVTASDALATVLEDVSMTGLSWYDFAKTVVRQVIQKGRCGTLIDFEDAVEKRPFCVHYEAKQIINWAVRRINGRQVLSLLTLHEFDPEWIPLSADEKEPDKFAGESYEQWRIFELKNDTPDGSFYVSCTVWRKRKGKGSAEEFVQVNVAHPTRRGVALQQIPFCFHGPNHGLPEIDEVPMLDLALVNLSLFRTSADLENGRHVAGIPTPWAAGFVSNNTETLKLGANVAWVSDNPQAKCGFLEFNGQGLATLETAVKEKKSEMAALGARMLEPEAKKAEAFATVEMRSASESSSLMAIAVSLSGSLSTVMQWLEWWGGTAETISELTEVARIELNTEFAVTTMKAPELSALFTGYLGGAIDFETLVWNLKRGEMVPQDADAETMMENIRSNPPGMPSADATVS